MAAVSDKAEFYIEQTVPELQEWLRKEIFSKPEITQITSRRTRFEHLVNSREATPSVYARYASYEMNLEALRKKRVKRLGVKMPMHTGQRRIFYILDRATKKFHGDLGLWMLYIEYARKCKAYKKTEELLTKVLRMHPAKADLWIYAANWAFDEEGDMDAARSYLQRGLRFCERAKDLWVEYAKLEMIYIAKIVGRRRTLGLDDDRSTTPAKALEGGEDAALDADTIALPSITAAELDTGSTEQERDTDGPNNKPSVSLVESGAIPLSVFDAAMKKFNHDEALAMRFFDVFADFNTLPCLRQVLQHVLDVLTGSKRPSIGTIMRSLKMPLVGTDPSHADFPAALGRYLNQAKTTLAELPENQQELAVNIVEALLPLATTESLDESLHRVANASLRRYIKLMDDSQVGRIAEALQASKHDREANLLLKVGLKQFGSSAELQRLQLMSKEAPLALDTK